MHGVVSWRASVGCTNRPKPAEWVLPVADGYQMECCDCGLVHTVDFRVIDGRAQMRMRRDNRATLMKRRHRFPELFQDVNAAKKNGRHFSDDNDE